VAYRYLACRYLAVDRWNLSPVKCRCPRRLSLRCRAHGGAVTIPQKWKDWALSIASCIRSMHRGGLQAKLSCKHMCSEKRVEFSCGSLRMNLQNLHNSQTAVSPLNAISVYPFTNTEARFPPSFIFLAGCGVSSTNCMQRFPLAAPSRMLSTTQSCMFEVDDAFDGALSDSRCRLAGVPDSPPPKVAAFQSPTPPFSCPRDTRRRQCVQEMRASRSTCKRRYAMSVLRRTTTFTAKKGLSWVSRSQHL
jgi:hypothetical protein